MDFGNEGVPSRFIDLVKNMHDGTITSVGITRGEMSKFAFTIDLHQGSTLSPYIFMLVMDELTKHIQEEMVYVVC